MIARGEQRDSLVFAWDALGRMHRRLAARRNTSVPRTTLPLVLLRVAGEDVDAHVVEGAPSSE